jgi:hypothetical protein
VPQESRLYPVAAESRLDGMAVFDDTMLLDSFVYAFAFRIATFDKRAMAETKRLVNLNSLPPDAEIAPEWDCFLDALARPAAQARLKTLFERWFHKPGDVETRLGYHVALLGAR